MLPMAGVCRRLAALVYDALLLGALWMLATLLVVAAHGGTPIAPGNLPYQLLLVLTAATFFIGFWLANGQTLGMRAWRLRVERSNGEPLDLRTGIVRFAAGLLSLATLGLGLLWLLIDRDRLTLHDRLAHTRVVVLPGKQARDTPPLPSI